MVRDPLIVPVRDPVIVPVREPVIVPTRELLREPGIVPPNETLVSDKVKSATNENLRNILFLLANLFAGVARDEERLLQNHLHPPLLNNQVR